LSGTSEAVPFPDEALALPGVSSREQQIPPASLRSRIGMTNVAGIGCDRADKNFRKP